MDVSIEDTGSKKERKLKQFHAGLYHRIFFNEACDSDFMIVSAEGRAFPCHTAILSSECEVFSTMLKINWVEVTTTRLTLQDLSAEGVDAFLRYLYLKDTQKPQNQFSVAVELYKTAHMFMLPDLTAEIKKIIMDKKNFNWYSDIESCIEFYRLTSIIKDERIQTRLLQSLKNINDSIENRWKIRDHCKIDPAFAVTLFWDIFSVCTCFQEPSENQFESESEPEDNNYL